MKARHVFGEGGKPDRFYLDGVQVTEKEYLEACPDKSIGNFGGACSGTWPMLSDALAVHPEQIPEVMERNRQHGIHVDYDPTDGRPILKDRGQRRDLLKLEGYHDNDGGYGDG